MFIKYGTLEIIDSSGDLEEIVDINGIGHIVEEKKGPWLYCRARALTCDKPNGNRDIFPKDEVKKAYQSFIGRGVYLNHNSGKVENAIGKIIDAYFVDTDPNDVHVECLFKINKEMFPDICKRIQNGLMSAVSMGCIIQRSECVLPTTNVYTLDGWKQIKDIRVGEQVLTHTGKFRRVLATSRRSAPEKLIRIRYKIANDDKHIGTLILTDNHPVLTERGWIKAIDLESTDKISIMAKNGYEFKFVDLVGIEVLDNIHPNRDRVSGASAFTVVCNLQVEKDESYIAEGVVVHNCQICGNIARNPSEYCEHLARYRGQKFNVKRDENGKYIEAVLDPNGQEEANEISHDITYTELSIVDAPADPTAEIKTIWASIDEKFRKMAMLLTDEINKKIDSKFDELVKTMSSNNSLDSKEVKNMVEAKKKDEPDIGVQVTPEAKEKPTFKTDDKDIPADISVQVTPEAKEKPKVEKTDEDVIGVQEETKTAEAKDVDLDLGRGVGGSGRRGNPKTDEERAETHGVSVEDLPPRGTGLGKGKGIKDEDKESKTVEEKESETEVNEILKDVRKKIEKVFEEALKKTKSMVIYKIFKSAVRSNILELNEELEENEVEEIVNKVEETAVAEATEDAMQELNVKIAADVEEEKPKIDVRLDIKRDNLEDEYIVSEDGKDVMSSTVKDVFGKSAIQNIAYAISPEYLQLLKTAAQEYGKDAILAIWAASEDSDALSKAKKYFTKAYPDKKYVIEWIKKHKEKVQKPSNVKLEMTKVADVTSSNVEGQTLPLEQSEVSSEPVEEFTTQQIEEFENVTHNLIEGLSDEELDIATDFIAEELSTETKRYKPEGLVKLASVCPSCFKNMLEAAKEAARKGRTMSEAAKKGLWKKFKGSKKKCIESMEGKVSNPAAYCRWLEGEVTGEYGPTRTKPGKKKVCEQEGEIKEAASNEKGTSYVKAERPGEFLPDVDLSKETKRVLSGDKGELKGNKFVEPEGGSKPEPQSMEKAKGSDLQGVDYIEPEGGTKIQSSIESDESKRLKEENEMLKNQLAAEQAKRVLENKVARCKDIATKMAYKGLIVPDDAEVKDILLKRATEKISVIDANKESFKNQIERQISDLMAMDDHTLDAFEKTIDRIPDKKTQKIAILQDGAKQRPEDNEFYIPFTVNKEALKRFGGK